MDVKRSVLVAGGIRVLMFTLMSVATLLLAFDLPGCKPGVEYTANYTDGGCIGKVVCSVDRHASFSNLKDCEEAVRLKLTKICSKVKLTRLRRTRTTIKYRFECLAEEE